MHDLRVSIQIIFFILCSFSFVPLAEAKNIESFGLPKSKLMLEVEFSNESTEIYKDRLVSLVDTYVAEGENLFGGPPKKLDGSRYTDLRIKLSSGLGGEASPEFIDFRIGDMKLFGFLGWEIALLHEILHLWSAHTFRYTDDQEQWFNEGVTEYLTFRVSSKLGLIDQDNVLNAFSTPVGNYLSAKGVGEHSLRSASKTDKLKKEHYFLIYHGGFVAGMVLDHQIRSRSNGKFTLDSLMRQIYQTHSRDNRYSSDSILKLIHKSMKLDFNPFFESYIYGSEIIPVGQYFDIGRLVFTQFGAPMGESSQQVLADMLTFK